MLTMRDFLDYCDLTEAEVAKIARREHVPLIVAAQLAHLLKQTCSNDARSSESNRDPTVPFKGPRSPQRHPFVR
jgi:hypothetical protein